MISLIYQHFLWLRGIVCDIYSFKCICDLCGFLARKATGRMCFVLCSGAPRLKVAASMQGLHKQFVCMVVVICMYVCAVASHQARLGESFVV